MCLDPVTMAIIGASVAAVGTGANYVAQKKQDHAMYRTFSREQDRQKALEADQVARWQDSVDGTKRLLDPAAQADAEAQRNAAMLAATKSAAPNAGAYLPGAPSAAPVVNAHAVEAGKSADARTAGLAKALAILGGMGDMMQKNDINIGHNAQSIGQLGGFQRGSLDVLQSEMDAAKQKGNNLKMLGKLAQSIGQSALTAGLSGMGASGPLPVSVSGQTPLASMPVNFPEMPVMAI